MPRSSPVCDHVLDLLSPLGTVAARPMFGGFGLYLDGVIFGIVYDETLYLKVDDTNRPDFESADMGPFQPGVGDKIVTMPYYEVPADVIEDGERLCAWARKALEVARRAKSKGRAKRH